MLKPSTINVHVSCSIFIFLSAGCQIMSSRRSFFYLVYRVKGSFLHCGEVQILFNMITEVLLEEEVIIGQGKGITGSGAVHVQPLLNWGAAKKQDRRSETQMESCKRDSAMYMDPSVFGQPFFQSDSWWLFYSCFLSFYSNLQICHEGKAVLFC